MKKFLALFLAALMTLCPVLAEEAPAADTPLEADTIQAAQIPSAWTVPYVADAYSLNLVDDNLTAYIQSPVTVETVATMADAVGNKLALLEGAKEYTSAEVDGVTRGDVVDALYDALSDTGFAPADATAVEALQGLNVLQGDGASLALDRVCTYEEAMVMSTRLILAVYDGQGAGSKGLFWKVTNGENTLYLLGTAHMDRGNIYPFHKTLREAITSSEKLILELDFNDQAGIQEFAAMQMYSEGDSLKEHISQELYTRTVALYAQLGLDEAMVNAYKPWALANSLNSILTADDSTGDAPMAIDLYVNAAASNRGITVAGAETYALQGGIFDSLSAEYQAEYLDAYVTMAELALSGEEAPADDETQAALDAQTEVLDGIISAWKTGDLEAFGQVYDKEAILESDDELNAKLFTDRDPGMVEVAKACLEQEGAHTTFMAVGAGHMVAPGGIVPELEALGYEVTQIK